MTLKISFSKMARDEMRRLSWLTAVQLLVFGLLIPFRVLIVMASMSSDARYNIVYTHQDMLEEFCRHVGFNCFENTLIILAAGILCAYCAFRYLYSPAKLDFYHSIPVKREKLLAVKLTASFGTFAVAYLFSQAAAVAVGAVFDAVNGRVILEMLVSSLRGLLYFLCSYSGALLAMMLTGKMLTAVLATATLGLYLPMLYLLSAAFQESFMSTALTSANGWSRSELLHYTSPWALCVFYKGGRMGLTGAWPIPQELLLTAAVTVLFFALSLILYRIRRTEASGSALAFRKLESVVKLLMTVPVALVAATVAYELYHSVFWEILFLVIFSALGCMIMEFIYRWDIRQVLTHKRHILLTTVLAGAIFFGMRYDLAGFNTYLPEKNQIAAMSVKSRWREDIIYRWQEEDGEVVTSGISTELLDYLETEDFGPIYRLAQDGVEREKPGRENPEYEELTSIGLKYRLKNGKEVYRCYWVACDLYEDVMNQLMKHQDYMERFYPIMTWTEEEVSGLNVWFYQSEELFPDLAMDEDGGSIEDLIMDENGNSIEVPRDRTLELVEAYREDLRTLSYTEVWDSYSICCFDKNGDRYGVYPLSNGMKNTKKLLREIAKNSI